MHILFQERELLPLQALQLVFPLLPATLRPVDYLKDGLSSLEAKILSDLSLTITSWAHRKYYLEVTFVDGSAMDFPVFLSWTGPQAKHISSQFFILTTSSW